MNKAEEEKLKNDAIKILEKENIISSVSEILYTHENKSSFLLKNYLKKIKKIEVVPHNKKMDDKTSLRWRMEKEHLNTYNSFGYEHLNNKYEFFHHISGYRDTQERDYICRTCREVLLFFNNKQVLDLSYKFSYGLDYRFNTYDDLPEFRHLYNCKLLKNWMKGILIIKNETRNAIKKCEKEHETLQKIEEEAIESNIDLGDFKDE